MREPGKYLRNYASLKLLTVLIRISYRGSKAKAERNERYAY